MRLVLLEDDIDQANTLLTWLRDAGHHVRHFGTLEDCRKELRRESFDILIVDWCLPDGSGVDLLTWLRGQSGGRHEPVIFTTARNSEEDTVTALQSGADDYLVKPIRRLELLSRLEALWRRIKPAHSAPGELVFPPYHFNMGDRVCHVAGEPVELTEKEFSVAVFLFQNRGNLLSRKHILEAVWGVTADLSTRTVDTHVSRVRLKLGLRPENGLRLASIYSFGYRLETVSDPA